MPKDYLDAYPNYVLQKGDLLISMTGTVGKEDYGNVCQVDTDEKYLLNQRVGKFEITSDKLNRDYLYFVSNTESFRKQLFANSSGGVRQANISNKGIEKVKIPMLSVEMQNEIVSNILNEISLINANKQLIEIFEQKIKERIAKVWGVETKNSESLLTPKNENISIAAEPETEYKIK